ncbi:MAG: imidazoleglycerol-phosphate dehydratase HisB [Thermodesulfobacteriota bacterium]
MKRKSVIERKTSEVEVKVDINLDGKGKYDIDTGVPFFDHMLSQFAKHGYFDLKLKAIGDIEVDYHHTVEDVGLAIGEAIGNALGDKKGISRFGEANVPFDESLVFSSIDLSGRPYLVYNVDLSKGKIGDFDSELSEEFFKSFSNSLKCNLHIELKYGDNLHHIVEATFKSVARALDKASALDPRSRDIPSTKGKL